MRITLVALVLLVGSMLYSCQKNDSTDPSVSNNISGIDSSSSQKQITAVVFRLSDNSSLPYDIPGVASADTVKFLFPPNTTINNLLPDISFLGKSISPANKTAHDFTNPVAYTITAKDGTTKQYIFSCSIVDSATMLLGKWSIVKDSLTNDGVATYNNEYPMPGVYTGTSTDYWEFTLNGLLNAHENNVSTTVKYHIAPNARLYIDMLSTSFDDAYVLMLTVNKATLFWTKTNAGGKTYTRTLNLKK